MELDVFVKSVLVGIVNGVKEANGVTKRKSDEPSFALKNAGWYVDKSNGCVWFNLSVESSSNVLKVVDEKTPSFDNLNRIKFNVAQVCALS